ncbi:MAG TPA: S1 RNA-binding domain-containing protein [Ilumatobacteraceae bacterium]
MPKHIVIDGSNLATEGRSMPSLRQLVEAVQAFMAEHPTALLTVVVDATFGHRIDPREVPEFDAAIDHNELVAPPAGAVGRGDAFVLAIADKVDATILSNDSYQEFHGEYPWLFDEGRLIGGKPVPNVGWVFVPRVPVRGPLSRRSQRDAKERGRSDAAPPRRSKAASMPPPVPLAPPPGAVVAAKGRGRGRGTRAPEPSTPLGSGVETGDKRTGTSVPAPAAKTDVPTPARSTMINDLLPFLGFVEHHPVGSVVQAVVESYSSHGAYVTIGDVRAYIPLRFMADPPPRSAREAMKLHDEVSLVVVGFHAQRRGIDLAAPELAASITGMTADDVAASATPTKRTRKSTKATAATPVVTAPAARAAAGEPPVKPVKAAARKRAAKTPIDEGGTPAGDAPAAAAAAVPKKAAPRTSSGRSKKAATESSSVVTNTLGEPPAAPAPTRRRTTKATAASAADTPTPTTAPTSAPTSAHDPAPAAPAKRSGAGSAKRAAGTTKRAPARSSKVTEPAPNAASAPPAVPAAKPTTRSRSKKAAAAPA